MRFGVVWCTVLAVVFAASTVETRASQDGEQVRFDRMIASMNLECNKLSVGHFSDALGNDVRGLMATRDLEMGTRRFFFRLSRWRTLNLCVCVECTYGLHCLA